MNAQKYACLIAIGLMTACAPPKPAPELPANERMPLEQRKVKTATISAWELTGAIAAKNDRKAWTASMNWLQQGPNEYQIRLSGPLGSGTVIIEKQGAMVTYRDGPKKITSSNADELLHKETGIRLPVNDLYYWVRGLPAPGAVQSVAHDAYNHLTSLKQAGYNIDYSQYTSVGTVDLPSKIQLQGHGMKIKLVIKHWSVH